MASTSNQSQANNPNNPNSATLCCLIENGTKCMRNAGNASYSKKIESKALQGKLNLCLDQRSNHIYICEHHKQKIQSIRTSGKRIPTGTTTTSKRNKDGFDSNNQFLADADTDPTNDSTLNNQSEQCGKQTNVANSNSTNKANNNNNNNNTCQPSTSELSISQLPIDFRCLQVSTLRKYKRFYKLPIKNTVNKNVLTEEVAKHFCTIPINEKEIIRQFMFKLKNDLINEVKAGKN